ncbi:hypothetical protein R3P38DRAFT_2770853 [Favolaschia claudopus]|uniref:Uncharacterized protein n=1 Tax=Favolaschia claudopus TaxID=2862362 RepID=A0AAW0CI96_9AGAR
MKELCCQVIKYNAFLVFSSFIAALDEHGCSTSASVTSYRYRQRLTLMERTQDKHGIGIGRGSVATNPGRRHTDGYRDSTGALCLLIIVWMLSAVGWAGESWMIRKRKRGRMPARVRAGVGEEGVVVRQNFLNDTSLVSTSHGARAGPGDGDAGLIIVSAGTKSPPLVLLRSWVFAFTNPYYPDRGIALPTVPARRRRTDPPSACTPAHFVAITGRAPVMSSSRLGSFPSSSTTAPLSLDRHDDRKSPQRRLQGVQERDMADAGEVELWHSMRMLVLVPKAANGVQRDSLGAAIASPGPALMGPVFTGITSHVSFSFSGSPSSSPASLWASTTTAQTVKTSSASVRRHWRSRSTEVEGHEKEGPGMIGHVVFSQSSTSRVTYPPALACSRFSTYSDWSSAATTGPASPSHVRSYTTGSAGEGLATFATPHPFFAQSDWSPFPVNAGLSDFPCVPAASQIPHRGVRSPPAQGTDRSGTRGCSRRVGSLRETKGCSYAMLLFAGCGGSLSAPTTTHACLDSSAAARLLPAYLHVPD